MKEGGVKDQACVPQYLPTRSFDSCFQLQETFTSVEKVYERTVIVGRLII